MGEILTVTPGVYVIMLRGETALFLRRLNTTYQLGMRMLPGGGVRSNEPISAAGVRELQEEVGVGVEVEDLKPIHCMYRPPHDETGVRADYFFVTDTWEGEPKINEPHKCDQLSWLPLNDLPDSVPEYVRVAIGHWLGGRIYSEYGWSSAEA